MVIMMSLMVIYYDPDGDNDGPDGDDDGPDCDM